jgi:hypothetical protein
MFDRVRASLRGRFSVAVVLATLALSGHLLARAATDYAARSLQRLASEQVAGAQLVGAAEPAPGARSSSSRDSSDGDLVDATKVKTQSVQLRKRDGKSRASRLKPEPEDPGAFDPDAPGALAADDGPVLSARELAAAIKNEGGHYMMARSFVERMLRQQQSAIAGARAVLYEQAGRVVGVKLSGIRRTSLLAKLGLQNGDLLRSINGYGLTTPDDALNAYSKLRNASRLSLAIARHERAITLAYSIEP